MRSISLASRSFNIYVGRDLIMFLPFHIFIGFGAAQVPLLCIKYRRYVSASLGLPRIARRKPVIPWGYYAASAWTGRSHEITGVNFPWHFAVKFK